MKNPQSYVTKLRKQINNLHNLSRARYDVKSHGTQESPARAEFQSLHLLSVDMVSYFTDCWS